MLRLSLGLAVWLFSLLPALAQDPDYLTDQATFDAGWSTLAEGLPDPIEIYALHVRPDRIELIARAAAGGPRLDAWSVTPGGWGAGGHRLRGPEPTQPGGPIGDVEAGLFAATALPLDRLVEIAQGILPRAGFADPGRVTDLRIARHVALIPTPRFSEVRWTITAGTGRETASIQARADGTLFALDIGNTIRGRALNFWTQDTWPFAEAQAEFAALIGPDTPVYAIEVRPQRLTVVAASPEGTGNETRITWDGGRFTRGLVDTPRAGFHGEGFRLDALELAALPKVLAAAAAALEGREQALMKVRAVNLKDAPNALPLHWEVTFGDQGRAAIRDSQEDTIVRVLPDGTVAHVRLPASLRPTYNFLDTATMIWARDAWLQGLKPDTPIFEVVFRSDRVNVVGMANGRSGYKTTLHLDEDGFRIGEDFPLMMETRADLYRIGVMSGLDPAVLDRIKAAAIEAIGVEGGEVYRIKLWSGGPFYQPVPDQPLFDVRVGLPPDHRIGGYAVFRMDGTLVEAFR